MPIHIERLTSDVSVQEGDVALTPSQLDKLAALVIAKLEERARETLKARAATKLTHQASQPLEPGE
jgi:hypothetical protein